MPHAYEYAIIRVMPSLERGEFLNVGVIVFCRTQRFLAVQLHVAEARLRAVFPQCDVEMVQAQLVLLQRIAGGEGPIGSLSLSERFHWLVAPRSTVIQTSTVHVGVCTDSTALAEQLLVRLVE